ncbi:amidohydrolase family protein [Algirhabdus cladophorae]|uniref:amidohydrolase family protein n=1 Tax=Algirhabdus cladophorae TaxID=3377108 RepID=UPI003B8472FC
MTLPQGPAPLPLQPPLDRAPDGACDAHVHLIDGSGAFPLWDKRVEDPAPFDLDTWLDMYRAHLENLGCSRGLIVHSILHGADNSVTVEAVHRMGEGFKGIGLVTDAAPDAELDQFVDWNMAGVRLNYVHGGVLSWEGVQTMAPRLAERGLHVQMLMNAHNHMDQLEAGARALPVDLVFDHIGWPDVPAGPDEPGFQRLLRLLETGKIWIKLSALYRFSQAPYTQTDPLVATLVAANPERCLWGSDWPHLMLGDADMPQTAHMLDAFHRVVTSTAHREQILVKNPAQLFKF